MTISSRAFPVIVPDRAPRTKRRCDTRRVEVSIYEAGADRLDDLRPLFLELHDHHRGVSAVELVEPDDAAWAGRRATYAEHLAAGRGLLHLAQAPDGRLLGYAFTILHDGSDDTFRLAPRYGDLYTLTVARDSRSAGVGTLLLHAVESALAARGVVNMTVAAMVDNETAIRFYRRHGFVPGELVLYRLRAVGAP
jgi:ribosomal protein S18 acetylase RimI-like enzyme